MTLLIVSNRLPFSINEKDELNQSSGGLVSAITGIKGIKEKKWIGIAPDRVDYEKWKRLDIKDKSNYITVFVENKLYKKYYNGISNDVIWPVFHYEMSMNFKWSNWEAYKEVNYIISKKISEVIKDDDLIWIHDFHLFLVPEYLRGLGIKNKIGFFLHIPFPSYELFRQIPSRKEILEGVLNSDLIGFHDYSYLKYFCTSVKSIIGINSNMLNMNYKNKEVNLGVFPISIETDKFLTASKSPLVKQIFNDIQETKNYKNLILGIDRLDYIKGLLIKLHAFRDFLTLYPEYIGKVSLLQIVIPSREEVLKYGDLKKSLERLISEINGEFSKPNYTPIQYIYSSISFENMIALYKAADILFVSSRRDGMNLVSFEYIASQDEENSGLVLLSEFTGASSTLSESILINPWDKRETAHKIAYCLKMSKEEKIIKNKKMLKYLTKYTVSDWADSFINELNAPYDPHLDFSHRILDINQNFIPMEFVMSKKLLIFLDYDGTLVPIEDTPENAILQIKEKNLINKLINNKKIEIVIVSGRDSKFIEEQFQSINNIEIACEHGAKFFNKKKWISLVSTNNNWFNIARKIIGDYSKRVPESFVDVKEYSIAWHYRLSPEEFSEYQSKKLKEELEIALSNFPVTVIAGKKVIEVKSIEADKGHFVNWYLKEKSIDDETFILAIGDDTTDEDMFFSLKNKGCSIKVGLNNTIAKYILREQKDVYKLLESINSWKKI
ncbi:MAG: bifunctional alpha,alpha-trehalose-phosphate synthase (UDP-forming)/trehalose-phosphatase [Candidatus Sericytochromatia bacterium]